MRTRPHGYGQGLARKIPLELLSLPLCPYHMVGTGPARGYGYGPVIGLRDVTRQLGNTRFRLVISLGNLSRSIGLVLHCTALNCTTVHCTAPHCTALYCTGLYCTVLYCTAPYCTVNNYCTVLYCTVLFCTVLYCTVLDSRRVGGLGRRPFEKLVQRLGLDPALGPGIDLDLGHSTVGYSWPS